MIASFSDTHTLPEATQKQGINIFLSLFHFTVTLIYCSASIGMLISLYIHTKPQGVPIHLPINTVSHNTYYYVSIIQIFY